MIICDQHHAAQVQGDSLEQVYRGSHYNLEKGERKKEDFLNKQSRRKLTQQK